MLYVYNCLLVERLSNAMWFGFVRHYLMIVSPKGIKGYLKNPGSDARMFVLPTNEQLVEVSTSEDQL